MTNVGREALSSTVLASPHSAAAACSAALPASLSTRHKPWRRGDVCDGVDGASVCSSVTCSTYCMLLVIAALILMTFQWSCHVSEPRPDNFQDVCWQAYAAQQERAPVALLRMLRA